MAIFGPMEQRRWSAASVKLAAMAIPFTTHSLAKICELYGQTYSLFGLGRLAGYGLLARPRLWILGSVKFTTKRLGNRTQTKSDS